jgi:hypothetical protein
MAFRSVPEIQALAPPSMLLGGMKEENGPEEVKAVPSSVAVGA